MRLSIRLLPALGRLSLGVLVWATMTGSEFVRNRNTNTLIVTNTDDNGAGSLRQTLMDANDGDTIQFAVALNGQTITLTSGELLINKNITISGPGPNALTVSRDQDAEVFRVLHVMPGHTVTIEGLTISGGHAAGAPGGGIFIQGDATISINNCTVSENFSDGGAGGGGIYSDGSLTITDSTVKLNRASFTFGNPTGDGGGIIGGNPLTIINSVIADNTAAFRGGGILCSGTITIINSVISGNWAGSGFEGSGFGGGILYGSGGGTLTIESSTVSGNTASGNESGTGGGITNGGAMTITNSTISGNFAYRRAGGIFNAGDSATTLTIVNSTMSGNWANQDGGGIVNIGGNTTLEIGNTILNAGASGANIFNTGGTVTSRGYNLSSDNGGGFLTAAGDQINTSPVLGPLQNNGGPTFTHAALLGSPAIDGGEPNFTPPPLHDQRGYDRVFNGRIDIGSLEVQPTPTPGPTATATATPFVTPTPTSTPTATPGGSVTPTPTPNPGPAQALNLATRLLVGGGDNVGIAGFIITGTDPKQVLIRGMGPSLIPLGVANALPNPQLELNGPGTATTNLNWRDTQQAAIEATGLAPDNDLESAILATLNLGAYTAILSGQDGGTGVALVEVYDMSVGAASKLGNIATRAFVNTGGDIVIAGFILGNGIADDTVVLRGIGSSLTQVGVPNALANPNLELRNSSGAVVLANDDWQDDSTQAALLQGYNLAPSNALESGIVATLGPGGYTALLSGVDGGTGNGLVEVYDLGGHVTWTSSDDE